MEYSVEDQEWERICICNDGWAGDRCEEIDTEYTPERPCGPEHRGHCANKSGCKLHWAVLAEKWDPTCTCSKGYYGARCDYPNDIHVFAAEETGGKKEGCYAENLEDGCQEGKSCQELTATSTHVICTEQLWLNNGNTWLMDWQKISRVKCVDDVWKSESSRVIGNSQLVCSNTAPSRISSNLWLVIIGSSIALVFIVVITCAVCCLCLRQRQLEQAAPKRNPKSPYYLDSSPEKTETTREE